MFRIFTIVVNYMTENRKMAAALACCHRNLFISLIMFGDMVENIENIRCLKNLKSKFSVNMKFHL